MKKQFVVLGLSVILIFLLGTCALAENVLNIGVDFGGQQKVTNSTSDVENGISIGYEYTVSQDQMDYGFGVGYQFERAYKSGAAGNEFNFIPVYGVLNIKLSDNKDIQPYLAARLGYSFYIANDAWKSGFSPLSTTYGGLYYAIGFGVDFKQAKAEALYMVNNGSLSNDRDVTYSTWGVKVGYKF